MIFRQTLSFFNLGMQKRLLYAPYHITHTCKRVWKCTAMREEICMFYDSQTSFILNFRMPCLVRREFLYISCYFLFINRVLEEIIAVPEFSAIFFRRMRPWNRRKATLWLPLYSLVRPFVCVSQCVCVCVQPVPPAARSLVLCRRQVVFSFPYSKRFILKNLLKFFAVSMWHTYVAILSAHMCVCVWVLMLVLFHPLLVKSLKSRAAAFVLSLLVCLKFSLFDFASVALPSSSASFCVCWRYTFYFPASFSGFSSARHPVARRLSPPVGPVPIFHETPCFQSNKIVSELPIHLWTCSNIIE